MFLLKVQLLSAANVKQGSSHQLKSVCGGGGGGGGMSSVIPVLFLVNPCLIDRFYF